MGPSLAGLLGAQRQAVTHLGGPLLVLGSAGSGKTSVIEARFSWLVEQGTEPGRIVVVAPSPTRADAIRAHLEAALQAGYEELLVLTPVGLAAAVCDGVRSGADALSSVLGAGDRLAMLLARIDELSLSRHDFGGNASALIGSFVRRIDRLKAELIGAEDYAAWAAGLSQAGVDSSQSALQSEFAEIYRTHERMLAEMGVRDIGDLPRDALTIVRERPAVAECFAYLLVDDAQELDLAGARLALAVGGPGLTAAGDPAAALLRFRGAGAPRIDSLRSAHTRVIELERGWRCPERIAQAGGAALGAGPAPGALAAPASSPSTAPSPPTGIVPPAGGTVELWRCANARAQAQSVAADVERLIAREGVAPGAIGVIVPTIADEGRAVAVALEERAVAHRLVGEAAFFQRAEIRDLLAWLRLLGDPSDAPAVVRALARPPIELRSVDIARCTQIARRRKLDMVAALASATESPQVPPESRERIQVFLKLYRAGAGAIDTTRPDLYVHRLIDRLALRRQHLFAAHADVVTRLRALARFGELASAYVRRAPQATAREFAGSIAAVADLGLHEQETDGVGAELEESSTTARTQMVKVVALQDAGGLEFEHVYVLGLHEGLAVGAPEPIPDALLREECPQDTDARRRLALRQAMYVAITRARARVVLAYPGCNDRGAELSPSPALEEVRVRLGAHWDDREEELFGPAEALHSTYRLLRDEMLQSTMRVGGRLGELRFDTDLDVSHAVVRYLELLKLAALIARPEDQGAAEALSDVNARILQAVTAEQREIFTSSALDEYLLDAERGVRRRAQAVAARDEPTLEAFLPKRGDGAVLSASDIDTYRACPLKYKFARVLRIPREPTLHQRFGILVHQVLERFHATDGPTGTLAELLGLLDEGWRRGGFGSSEEERQLCGKAASALTRYHVRFQREDSEPIWFERPFTFKLGPHLVRGRVDRVDRLPGGGYELIDYKTGRPKGAAALLDDVQLSLYAVAAREAWQLDASRQAYYYLLDDQKITVPVGDGDRSEWIREVATEVAEGILSQGFEPTPSAAACSICDYRLACPAAER
ncbi:MAG: ATP-dependent helicase [Solirubrobacteraceae bacterium]